MAAAEVRTGIVVVVAMTVRAMIGFESLDQFLILCSLEVDHKSFLTSDELSCSDSTFRLREVLEIDCEEL